ncbi:hypothetical protein GF312_10165 [Candidatus Poribacteria bacterium]|nr:hypothetical protein [Candidatus Poribacteria bacterium]
MKIFKSIIVLISLFMLLISCSNSGKSKTPESAREILEKTYDKYSDLFKNDAKELKTIDAKITVKGGANLPMGEGGEMPMEIDVALEMKAKQPQMFYLDISGNLGNAILVASGKDGETGKPKATLMLPSTKQFAVLDAPDNFMNQIPEDEQEEEQKKEEILEKAILEHEGMVNLKNGRAHKIIIKSKNPSENSHVVVYILDKKWDPARLEMYEAGENKAVVEFEKLDLNKNISDREFMPNTEGYKEVTQNQIVTIIMMQVMASMMQKGQE